MLGLKLIEMNKRGSWYPYQVVYFTYKTSSYICIIDLYVPNRVNSNVCERENSKTASVFLPLITGLYLCRLITSHYNDVIMSAMVSQSTSLTIVYSSVYSGADQRKHQRSPSLAFVRGIHRWPVNSAHKEPVTRKMFPFDDVIMYFVDLAMWFGAPIPLVDVHLNSCKPLFH